MNITAVFRTPAEALAPIDAARPALAARFGTPLDVAVPMRCRRTMCDPLGERMATVIPSIQSIRDMQPGERRFAERLEAKLENDYLIWYNLSVGESQARPDFLVLHPSRGLLVLEVKDWRIESIRSFSKTTFTLLVDSSPTDCANPLEQATKHAWAVADLLKRDPALRKGDDEAGRGKLRFPWAAGVVLTRITRQTFEKYELDKVIPSHLVICKDEMLEGADAEAFQTRLWSMFKWVPASPLSLPDIDRIRFHLYPEVRIERQMGLFSPEESIPDVLRIMDLQQEQLARSLGEGHRVIHGVAGSGKTMVLAYRCEHLAKATSKPILVLCYNKTLAARLHAMMLDRGLAAKVSVRSFHAWCREQLVTYHVPLPPAVPAGQADAYAEALVERIIAGVERGHIPAGQYGAVLIDEGHDFEAHWLKLVVQMVSPETSSLLVLYDDAQSIYGRRRRGKFSFKSVGIQAQGRTTLLKVNYRNTAQVCELATAFARDVLAPADADEDGVPLVRAEMCARRGAEPLLVRLPSLHAEARWVVERFQALHADDIAWREMAVVYRSGFVGEVIADRFREAGIPLTVIGGKGTRGRPDLAEDSVKAITFHSSKGLEFPVVAIPGIGFLPNTDADMEEEVRLMYVAMTRAMDRLLLTCHRESPFARRLNASLSG